MTSLRYKFTIPDRSKPLPGDVPPWGPTCELIHFEPPPLTGDAVVGRMVDEICTHVGTYGMGGPGFFGLRLGGEWLVIAIWGAASWVRVDDRIVQDVFWDKNGRHRPWITDRGDELAGVLLSIREVPPKSENRLWQGRKRGSSGFPDRLLVGQPITSFEVAERSLTVGIGVRTLSITESPESRPILEGNGEPRCFERADDLRRAVFLSPTAEIWV